jgi:hypothetical protein
MEELTIITLLDPTTTPTPTEILSFISTLPSGSYYEVTKSITAGDIAITSALMLVALLLFLLFVWTLINNLVSHGRTDN